MIPYLQQLQDDQSALRTMLEQHRTAHTQTALTGEDPVIANKALRPSVRLIHQAYIYMLEDALQTVESLIEYFQPVPQE